MGMKISDFMTKDVVTVRPDDSIIVVAELFAKHGHDGFPVVGANGTLLGLVTQFELMTADSHIHIPTVLDFFKKFDLYKKDKVFVQKQLKKINKIKVSDIMNSEPPIIYENDNEDTAIVTLSRTHGVSPVSVVTANRILRGVITRADLFKLYGETPNNDFKRKTPEASLELLNFLNEFEANFIFISKARTRAWLMINITFLIGGVILALAVFF